MKTVVQINAMNASTDDSSATITSDAPIALIDFMERASVELTEHVISPSEFMISWMQQRSWKLPPLHHYHVLPNMPSHAIMSVSQLEQKLTTPQEIKEFVYFGKLDDIKGFNVFVTAMNTLSKQSISALKSRVVVLVGKGDKVKTHSQVRNWRFKWRWHGNFTAEEAWAYLQGPGRVVVIPSQVDNSPNVVVEWLAHKDHSFCL
jgi:glycosyltransferase involved in cell wall biosynthesis